MLKLHQQLIHCPSHKEKITQLNIEPNCPVNQRALCKKCINDGQTIQLDMIEQLLQKNETSNLCATQKFVQQIHQQFNILKQQFLEELLHFETELEKTLHPLTNQKEKLDYYLMPETTLSLLDLQELGQLLAENILKEDDQYVINFSKTVTKHDRERIQNKFKDLETLLQEFRDSNNNKLKDHHQWKCSPQKLSFHSRVLSMGMNKKGDVLVIGMEDQQDLHLYRKNEIETWQLEHKLNSGSVTKIYYSKFQDWFISVNQDQQLILWKLRDTKWMNIPIKQEHYNTIWGVIFNEDETIMATCSEDRTIKLWYKHEDTIKLIQTLDGHIGAVYCVAFHKDMLASGGQDKQLILWRYRDKDWELYDLLGKHHYPILALHYHNNRLFIQLEKSIEVWDKQRELVIECKPIIGMIGYQEQLINYDHEGNLYIWNNERCSQTINFKSAISQVIIRDHMMLIIEGKHLHQLYLS